MPSALGNYQSLSTQYVLCDCRTAKRSLKLRQILIFDIVGFLAVMLPLWAIAPKAKTSDIFGSFLNGGPWPGGVGGAFFVGLLAPAGALIGADSAAHLSEEVKDASLTVPRVMFWTLVINGILGFIGTCTFVASVQSIEDQVINSTASFPFIGIYQAATGSTAGAIGMTVPFIVLQFSMCLNAVAAASRQAWSFARDEVSDRHQASEWSRCWPDSLSTSIAGPALLTLVRQTYDYPKDTCAAQRDDWNIARLHSLRSDSAWRYGSFRQHRRPDVRRYWSHLRRQHRVCPLASVIWRTVAASSLVFGPLGHLHQRCWLPCRGDGHGDLFLSSFQRTFSVSRSPAFLATKAVLTGEFLSAQMNWGIAMFGGIAILCAFNYVVGPRKVYKGPVVHIKKQQ
jgi:choline transport protein